MKIVFAERKDTAEILDFIMALAEYEKMSDEVVADEEISYGYCTGICRTHKDEGCIG